MQTTIRAVLGVLLLVLAAPAGAFESGNELLPYCKKGLALSDGAQLSMQDGQQGSLCVAYIRGLLDGHLYFANLEFAKAQAAKPSAVLSAPLFCMPGSKGQTDVVQMTRVIVHDWEQRPESLHLHPMYLVFGALRRAFPCK